VTQLTIREVRAALPRIDEVLAREGDVVITRRGEPVARLVPVTTARPVPSHAELRASLPRLDRPSEQLVRADRDERGGR